MDQEALRDIIIQRTVAGENRDNLILNICEQTGAKWDEVEALVGRTVEENRSAITLRQSPALVLLALTTFVGGCISLGVAVIKTYDFFSTILASENAPVAAVGVTVYFVEYLPYLTGWITVGIGMILGSLLGMQRIWEAVFDRFKISV